MLSMILLKLPLGPLRDYIGYPISYTHRINQQRLIDHVANVVQKRLEEQKDGLAPSPPRTDGIERTLRLLPEFSVSQGQGSTAQRIAALLPTRSSIGCGHRVYCQGQSLVK